MLNNNECRWRTVDLRDQQYNYLHPKPILWHIQAIKENATAPKNDFLSRRI